MPLSDYSRRGRGDRRRLAWLFWIGVGLAPIAALLLVIGDGQGPLRAAAVLALVAVMLIGLAVVFREDPADVRDEMTDTMRREVDLVRQEVEGLRRGVEVRLRHELELVRGELESTRRELERRPEPMAIEAERVGELPAVVYTRTDAEPAARRGGTVYASTARSEPVREISTTEPSEPEPIGPQAPVPSVVPAVATWIPPRWESEEPQDSDDEVVAREAGPDPAPEPPTWNPPEWESAPSPLTSASLPLSVETAVTSSVAPAWEPPAWDPPAWNEPPRQPPSRPIPQQHRPGSGIDEGTGTWSFVAPQAPADYELPSIDHLPEPESKGRHARRAGRHTAPNVPPLPDPEPDLATERSLYIDLPPFSR